MKKPLALTITVFILLFASSLYAGSLSGYSYSLGPFTYYSFDGHYGMSHRLGPFTYYDFDGLYGTSTRIGPFTHYDFYRLKQPSKHYRYKPYYRSYRYRPYYPRSYRHWFGW